MKRLISFILAAVLFLLPSLAYGVTATAFKRLFLSDMYYNHLTWSENQQYGQIRETAVSGGKQYEMYVEYEYRNGMEEINAIGLSGPLDQLIVDYDPYTEYGSGYKMRKGAEVYTAFFNAIYDIGILPDDENGGTFFEASMLAPYDIYTKLMSSDEITYYDHNTWSAVLHDIGFIEAVHKSGTIVIITGEYGGNFEVYVVLP